MTHCGDYVTVLVLLLAALLLHVVPVGVRAWGAPLQGVVRTMDMYQFPLRTQTVSTV